MSLFVSRVTVNIQDHILPLPSLFPSRSGVLPPIFSESADYLDPFHISLEFWECLQHMI